MLSSLFRRSGTGGSGRQPPEKQRSLDGELAKIKERSGKAERRLRQYINEQLPTDCKYWFEQAVCRVLRNLRCDSHLMRYPHAQDLARFPPLSSTDRASTDCICYSVIDSGGLWQRLLKGNTIPLSGMAQR